MTARRDLIEAGLKLAVVLVVLAPVMPDAAVWWYVGMRTCQGAARRFGLAAIAAENRYRRAVA